jgi:hypothetical protein
MKKINKDVAAQLVKHAKIIHDRIDMILDDPIEMVSLNDLFIISQMLTKIGAIIRVYDYNEKGNSGFIRAE